MILMNIMIHADFWLGLNPMEQRSVLELVQNNHQTFPYIYIQYIYLRFVNLDAAGKLLDTSRSFQ